MKKIISMLCVVAMMLSFVAISANASGEKISLVANEAATTEDVLAFDVVVECAEGVKATTVQVKYDGFLTNNSDMTTSDFSAVKVSGATANNVTAQKFITTNYTDTSASNTVVTLATIKVNKANFKNDAAFYFTANTQVNGVKSYATAGLEVAAPGSEDDDEADIAVVEGSREAVTSTAADTDYQIGTAIGMEIVAKEGLEFNKMKWAIQVGENRLYSKTIDFALPVSGQFSVAATFLNGTHLTNYPDEALVESYDITEDSFDVILGAVDGDEITAYFTNDEADNK